MKVSCSECGTAQGILVDLGDGYILCTDCLRRLGKTDIRSELVYVGLSKEGFMKAVKKFKKKGVKDVTITG